MTPIILEILKTFCVFWHVTAFAFGGVFVWYSYRALLGYEKPQSFWGRTIQKADIHLWASGFAVIAVGMAVAGVFKYLNNPKLWAKFTVVAIWLISTQYMRLIASKRFLYGDAKPFHAACSVNLACWICGALLGCAKGLANGVVPFWTFISVFFAAQILCLTITFSLLGNRNNKI
jgi:hypothetical protein